MREPYCPLQTATQLSQHYHYLRWPNLHVRCSVTFYIIFVYKVYVGFSSRMCDWTVAVAHSTVYLKISLYNNFDMLTHLTMIFN